MTAADLRAWQKRRGWTRPLAAEALGIALVTYDGYLYGSAEIAKPVAKLVRAYDVIAELDAQLKGMKK